MTNQSAIQPLTSYPMLHTYLAPGHPENTGLTQRGQIPGANRRTLLHHEFKPELIIFASLIFNTGRINCLRDKNAALFERILATRPSFKPGHTHDKLLINIGHGNSKWPPKFQV